VRARLRFAYRARLRLQVFAALRSSAALPADLGRFVERIGRASAPVPLLVVRARELQRVAWSEGRPAARRIERDCWRKFVAGSARVLRAGDVLGHARDSEDFLAALLSGARSPGLRAGSLDCRAALRRLADALAREAGAKIESGWTMLEPAPELNLSAAIERALQNGARENERYAFFSTVGHELRTPLSAVRGYVETLLDERLDSATARRYLETARSETLRMSRLVDGMFDISLLDLREATPPASSAMLAAAVRAAAEAVAPQVRAHGSRLELDACGGIEVALGRDALTQILINLLDNAVKHGRVGGRVELGALRRAAHVELWIDDDGAGIPPDERESIFALGQRSAGVRAVGNGLGLAFVRLMLERTGGAVEACDSPLGGARFRLWLPLPLD
jgi:signal transduction histidine kinase